MAFTTEPNIRVGTSAFTAAGWEGAFYPAGMQPRDFLTYYATQFNTVEVDSTFYRTPARSTVAGWADKTPPGFVFSLKVPQVITHEKCLEDCDEEFKTFVDTAEALGNDKLGPLLLQFPYLQSHQVQERRRVCRAPATVLEKTSQRPSIRPGNPQ